MVGNDVAERLLDAVRQIELIVTILVNHQIDEAIELAFDHRRRHGRADFAHGFDRAEKNIRVGACGMTLHFVQ